MAKMSPAIQAAWEALEEAQRSMREKGIATGVPGLIQAIQGFHHEGDHAAESYALNLLAGVQNSLGNFQESANYHEAGLTAARLLSNPGTLVVEHLDGLGVSLSNMGRWQEAQQLYEQALAETDKPIVAMRKCRARVLSHLADLYSRYTDHKEEALGLYDNAIAISNEYGDLTNVAISLNMRGQTLEALERPEEALHHYEQARGILEQANEPASLASCYSHIGQSYYHLDKVPLALQYIKRAVALDRQSGNKQGLTRDLLMLARIQDSLGNGEDALVTLQEAFLNAKEMHDLKLITFTLENLAQLCERRLQTRQARKYLEMALDYSRELGDKHTEIHFTTLLAAYGERPDLFDAIEKNLASARERGQLELESDLEISLARLYEQGGDLLQAKVHYVQAARLIEQMRSSYKAEDHLRAFNASRADDFDHLIEICLKLGEGDEAFVWAERSRARVLQSIRHNRSARTATVLSDKQLAEYRRICDCLINIDMQIQRLELADESVSQELREQLQDALQSEADLVLTAWRAAQGVKESAKHTETRISDLQDCLSTFAPATAVLSYYTFDSDVYAFMITAESFSTHKLKSNTTEIRRNIRQFREGLGIREIIVRDQVQSFDGSMRDPIGLRKATDYLSHSQQLYNFLISPFQELIERSNHLCIIPHGPLHFLPFQALYDGEEYLIEKISISYAPSVAIMLECLGKNRLEIRKALALGDPTSNLIPLTFAREEVERVRQLLGPEHCRKEVGPDATRAVVMQAGNNVTDNIHVDVWHFAMHAQFVQSAPHLSYLQLAQSESSDGRLFAYEIASLKSVPRLNILSACRTAMTREAHGDDLSGLLFSFLAGGAQMVMASLWSVEDRSTADLMTEFYKHSRDEKPTDLAQSLRQAQLMLLRQPKTSSPIYWAPFVLHGNWNPIPPDAASAESIHKPRMTHKPQIEVEALMRQADSYFGRASIESEKHILTWLPDAEREQLEQAIKTYTLVLEQESDHAAALRQRGMAYYNLYKMAPAKADLRRATELDESDSVAAAMLGMIYAEKKDCEAAITYLSRAFQINSRIQLQYPGRNTYRLRSRLQGCLARLKVTEYTSRIVEAPEDWSLYVERAQAYWMFGIYGDNFEDNKERALTDLERALSLKPHSALALVRRAWIKDPGAANDIYERAVRIDPNCAEAHLRLAQSLKHEEGQRAIAEFNAALACDPFIEHVYCGLGQKYIDVGDLRSSLEAFEKELERDPNCFDAYLYLSQIYFALDRLKEAAHAHLESIRTTSHTPYQGGPGIALVDDLVYWICDLARNMKSEADSKSVGLERQEIQALLGKANRLANAGESGKAAAVYTEILLRDTENARVYAYRGGCYASLGEYEKALADLHRAIELNPNNAAAWFNLSVVYENLMQFAEARKARDKALLLDPEIDERRR